MLSEGQKRVSIAESPDLRGYVDWELIDDKTGKVVRRGKRRLRLLPPSLYTRLPFFIRRRFPLGSENAIVDDGRNQLANAMIGTTVTFPEYMAVGTGTNLVASSDTDLQTISQYDGSNDAKIASGKSLFGNFTSRLSTQFLTTEANVNIRELGLFDAANAGKMWARVNVVINKTSSQRLNVFWYIVFERRSSLAIKTGSSIGATGTSTANTVSTLTFVSAVTVMRIFNNTGGIVYIRLNDALDGTTPTNYDYKLADQDEFELLNEEISISTLSILATTTFTMPHNTFVARGW